MVLGEEYTGDYSDPTDEESDIKDTDDDDDNVEEDDYVETAKVMNVDDDDDDDHDVTDYDYDANFGIVMNENDLQRAAGAKEPPSYDYSHFDVYNAVRSILGANDFLWYPKENIYDYGGSHEFKH